MSLSTASVRSPACIAILLCTFFLLNSCNELDSVLSDAVFYHITWPGKFTLHPQTVDRESIVVSTENNEKYTCTIPRRRNSYSHEQTLKNYRGQSPRELIEPLFLAPICSFRIEKFWTYELCHGKSVRQYHEELNGGKIVKTHEYFLGYYKYEKVEEEIKVNSDISQVSLKKRSIRINNHDYPFVEVNMTDGTFCAISKKPRASRLLYICQEDGRGEIYEIKETSSCQYDVIVFSKLLCEHPAFRPQIIFSNNIECFALDGSSRRPHNLDLIELESANMRVPISDAELLSIHQQSFGHSANSPDPAMTESKPEPSFSNIISGKYCFTGGGHGWWLTELCLGRFATQYHVDGKSGQKTYNLLGKWNYEMHKAWIEKNREKKFVKGSKFVYLYYTEGDFCQLLGDYRTVIVKLVCSNSVKLQVHTLELTEPTMCRYQLVLESQLMCPVLDLVDEAMGVPITL